MIGTDRLELPIGLGTGHLWGESEKARSLNLLAAAYDAGIRYFDTARLYANGRAEGVLGEYLSAKRGEVVITSKAGIAPVPDGVIDKALGKAQKAASLIGLAKPPAREPVFGQFDLRSLHKSVAKSLRELRTDRLDALLLHEVSQSDLANGEVRGFLDQLVADGRIGAYGVATTRAQTATILASAAQPFSIVQAARTVFDVGEDVGASLSASAAGGPALRIHHSVLAGALPALSDRGAGDEAFARDFERETGVQAGDRGALAGLLLAEAIDANPQGITLFSSSSPGRIREAARIARERPYGRDQIAGLRRVVAALKPQS